ncbi:MAG TPA: hypothetical protein VGM13_06430 [Thermoanaerobaculia bacterium]|jgi:hypothetical protein
MKRISIWLATAALAFAPLALNAQNTPAAATPSAAAPSTMSGMTAPTPVPTPTLVDDIIKLWKANLSEDFLKKYLSTTDAVKELSAEDIVRLRNAGLPENLILAITQRKMELAGMATPPATAAAAAVAAAAPAPVMTPAPTPAPTPVPTPPATAKWEGLARRNSGVVLFKSRWDPGMLEVKDETLRWTDAKDVTKNLLVPLKSLTEQQLTCLKRAGGNECFEWVAKTRTDEFRFRNVAWEQNENGKVQDVFSFLKTLNPQLVSSQVPVDQK